MTTCVNGNVQSYDQEESKLNSIVNTNSGAHTLTHGKITKTPFNKNNEATIKSKQNAYRYLITRVCQIGTKVTM